MMPTSYKIYQVDAFTTELFKGNPAAVVFLDTWLADKIMLQIAQENALAETAFLIKDDQGYHLRIGFSIATACSCHFTREYF
jgi:PhzF family phenazine biosynthesis protein